MDRDAIIKKMLAYKDTLDDDNIRWKEKIKQALLECDELIYALNNEELEKKGADNDEYFGINIRPYLLFPDSQTEVSNYLCFKVDTEDLSKANKIMKFGRIIFVVMCRDSTNIDRATGIARHDLISSIVREKFNWSNIFGLQCKLVSNKESTTDSNFATRTMVFELTTPNSIVRTEDRTTSVINTRFRH